MAKQNGTTPPQAPHNGNGAPQFVRCDLTNEQKKSLESWALGQEEHDLLEWVDRRCQSGHVVSVRSNEIGYQCSVTGVRESSGHQSLSLVARASTPIRALYSAWYKDEVALQGQWPLPSLTGELDF